MLIYYISTQENPEYFLVFIPILMYFSAINIQDSYFDEFFSSSHLSNNLTAGKGRKSLMDPPYLTFDLEQLDDQSVRKSHLIQLSQNPSQRRNFLIMIDFRNVTEIQICLFLFQIMILMLRAIPLPLT